jgi:hypothetical protein
MDALTLPSLRTKAFTPSGRWIEFTVSATSIAELIAKAFELDTQLAAAGLSVREPGLNEGEQRETITYVVRRSHMDGERETPMLDLYPEKLEYRFMSVYLNTPEDVAIFEQVSGMKLMDIPYCNFTSPLQRGKDGRNDAAYLRAMPKPTGVIFKMNPAYEEGGKKAKRLFVRWADAATPPPPTTPAAAQPAPELEKPATAKNGNGSKPDALQTLKARVMREIDSKLTEVQIAALAGIKQFSNTEEWRNKFGGLDKAFEAIKAEHEFQNLGDLSTVEF